MSWRDRIARELVQRHARLRPVLPRGYKAYRGVGGRIYLDVRESPMMLARALRAYEPGRVAALRAALEPGMVFVDVGGNKGDFSLLAARVMGDEGRVLCVEPEAENASWIERSAARNHYRSIEVIAAALAERDGEDTLFLGAKSGWHTLVEDPSLVVGTQTVPIRTLDSLLAERGIDHVDVVKIDVEGAEDRVLAGATAAFGGDNPMTILIDLHPKRVDTLAVCDQLRSWGFGFDREINAGTKEAVATRR
jgi:FkbM family methyltransferase